MAIEIELKRCFRTGKVLAGIKETEESILLGKTKGVIVSRDLPKLNFLRIKYVCDLAKVPFLSIEYTPLEIGKVVGLSYSISALSIIDEGKSKILQEIENPDTTVGLKQNTQFKVDQKIAKKKEKKDKKASAKAAKAEETGEEVKEEAEEDLEELEGEIEEEKGKKKKKLKKKE